MGCVFPELASLLGCIAAAAVYRQQGLQGVAQRRCLVTTACRTASLEAACCYVQTDGYMAGWPACFTITDAESG
jgi:hypothetical protein